MKLNNRFIFGILSLVLAAVIAFVALPTIARQTNGKTEIVRITQPVLKGEQVTKENAEVVEVPASFSAGAGCHGAAAADKERTGSAPGAPHHGGY